MVVTLETMVALLKDGAALYCNTVTLMYSILATSCTVA